jgi:hypothetical protein
MGTDQDYPTSGFAENKITLGHKVYTHNIKMPCGNCIPWGQIKITQNLDSQKIRLHLGLTADYI